MKGVKTKCLKFFLFLLLGILCLAFLALRSGHSRQEPSYGGQTLSQWLQAYMGMAHMASEAFTPDHPYVQNETKAIRAMGTNCIPSLLEMVDAPDVPHSTEINRLLSKLPGVHYRISDPEPQWQRGCVGFIALDTVGNPAESKLLKIVKKSSNGYKRHLALLGLAGVSTNRNILLPLLLKEFKAATNYGPDPYVAWFLHKRFPEEAQKAGVNKYFEEYVDHDSQNLSSNAPTTKR
jgi:hypothetical protein